MDDDKLRGKHLAYLRKSKGLKQIDLAELLHYSDKNISKWENGKSFPTDPDILNNLANVLEVTVDELIFGYKDNNSNDNDNYSHNSILNCFITMKYFLLIVIIFCVFICFILFSFNNSLYAVISNNNIDDSYIIIKLGYKHNVFKFNKLKNKSKKIKLINFYYKLDGNDYLLFESENQNLSLTESKNSLEYNFEMFSDIDCYLKVVYEDNSFDIIDVNFKEII